MMCLRRRLLTLALFVFAVAEVSTAQAPNVNAAKSAAVSRADLLDINTATPAQLKSLKGIGDAYAKRIVDGRPYAAKNQLTARGVLPQGTYDGIKDLIVAHAVKK